jgi:biofilm PGA synthesis N-glycosyltransferase PgaC
VIVAAFNEERASEPMLEHIGATAYAGPLEVMLADNNSTDRTVELGASVASRLGLSYRRSFEPLARKHHALNTALLE